MSTKWYIIGTYFVFNSLSLLLFWLGDRAITRTNFAVDWVAFALSILLPGGIICYLAYRHEARLNRIYQATKAIAEGRQPTDFLADSSDLLGMISQELDNLAQQVRLIILKNAQEARKIQAILTGMQEGVVALDHVGRVVLINRAAERMFGQTQEEAGTKTISNFTTNQDLERLVREALEDSRLGNAEIRLSQRLFVRIQVSPIPGTKGRPMGVVIVCYDITELRRLEQMRTEFVGNVSHELRTPLTSIKGFVETLLDGAAETPAVRDRFLNIIQEETLRLQRLIDDLLTLSRIENRRGDQLGNPVGDFSRLQDAYEKIRPVLEPYADAKGITLEIKLPQDLPPVNMGIDLLSQILLNLMENAIKYTAEGRVWLQASWKENVVYIEFGDTGSGIPKDDLPRVFERFYRVDKARSRDQGGTGLGLSIVKHIVEGSKGKIGVSSQVGQGSIFFCELPIVNGVKA